MTTKGFCFALLTSSVLLVGRNHAAGVPEEGPALVELNVHREGKVVAGARLVFKTASGGRREAATNPAGAWSGRVGVAGESLYLAVAADGFPVECRVVSSLRAGKNLVERALRRSGSITARVVDGADAPIADVELKWKEASLAGCDPTLLIPGYLAAAPAQEAQAAVFRLDGILAGSGVVEVAAPGYERRSLGPMRVPEGGTLDLGTVRLEPRQFVSGSVKTASGNPVGRVSVSAYSRIENRSVASVTTDEHGRYEIDLPGTDPVTLRAGDPPGPVGAKEGVAPRMCDVTIILPEPATLGGEVRTSDQKPVQGAAVVASFLDSAAHERKRFGRRTKTDEQGRFVLENLRAGAFRVEVRAPGFAPSLKAPVDLVEGERRDVQVLLNRGLRLEGVVLEAADRRPVAGAVIRMETSHSDEGARSDDHGRFELFAVSPGVIRILATHAQKGRGAATVDPQAGAAEILLTPDGAVEGVVTGEGGAPLDGKTVEIHGLPLRVETDPAGHYRIEGVPAGGRRVVLRESLPGSHSLLEARDVEVPANETVQVDFERATSVSGRVLWNEVPLRNALVTFTRMNEGRPSGNLTDTLATARSDHGGEYRIEGLRPGPYTASARGRGGAIYRSVEIREEGPNRVDLEVGATTVQGIVLDASTGEQIGEAKVVAFDPTRSFGILESDWQTEDGALIEASQVLDSAWAAYAGRDGRFQLSLPEGRYRLEASAAGYETARHEVSVASDRPAFVEMALQRSWSLHGTVVDAWGNAVAGAGVAASCGAGATTTTLSDAEGFFRFEKLTAGLCALVAYQGGYGLGLLEAVSTEDRERLVRIEIRRSGSLRIELPAGARVEDAPVLASPAGSSIETLLSWSGFSGLRPTIQSHGDAGWTSRYPALPPGPYVLISPGSGARSALAVGEGEENVVDLRD